MTCILATTHSAHAQTPQETALARTLFQEGVKLADRGDWANAADRFARAYSVKPTPGIAFNWGRALAETGKVLQARELLVQVARDESADAQLRRESEAMLATVEPRIPRLRVTLDREPDQDTQITVDENPWPRAAWGVGSPIDPGSHTVVCSDEGREVSRVDVALREGELREVNFRLPGNEGEVKEPANAPGQAHRDELRKPLAKNWMLWTAVGAVVVGGTVAAILLAKPDAPRDERPIVGNANPGVLRW